MTALTPDGVEGVDLNVAAVATSGLDEPSRYPADFYMYSFKVGQQLTAIVTILRARPWKLGHLL
jgi:hypothetical protein